MCITFDDGLRSQYDIALPLLEDLNLKSFSSENDRVMICGSEDMTNEIKQIFEKRGCTEGSTKVQGGFVIEKAFAEK